MKNLNKKSIDTTATKNHNIIFNILSIFFVVFVCFRDIIALYTTEYIKIIPDIMIFMLFIFVIVKNYKNLKISKGDKIVFSILILGTLISILNQVNLTNIIFQLRSISIIYILYFSTKNLGVEIKYKKIVYTFCAITIFLTLFSIIEIISEKELLFPEVWKNNIVYSTYIKRAYSLLNNPNTYAAFAIITYIMIDLRDKKNNFEKVLTVIMFLIALIAVGISASRSGAIAFVIYLIYRFLTSFKNKSKNTKILLAGTASLIIIISSIFVSKSLSDANAHSDHQELPFFNRVVVDVFSGKAFNNNVVDGRIYKINKALELFQDKPLAGFGLGTFGSSGSMRTELPHYQKYEITKDFYSDNEYIVILVETGIIGIVMFSLFVSSFIKENIKSRGLVPIMIVLAFLGLFYNIIEVLPLTFLSLFAILSTHKKESNSSSSRRSS
ncbi:O-antigen ligase family protein [Candidatus Saccharibacteria bacterium]|nr:O-antigen ligase family protein [Candidatus Saccharibacteria bacterium]